MNLLAAVLVGLTAATAVVAVLPTPVRVARRIAPYVQTHRRRSGLASDIAVAVDPGFATNRGPAAAVARAVGGVLRRVVGDVIDTGDDAELRLRLRRAGVEPPTSATYRAGQMRFATAGAILALVATVVLGGLDLALLLLLTGVGFLGGTLVYKVRLEQRAKQRTITMQLALSTVTQLLAVLTRANRGPVGAVRHLVGRSHGPLIDELRIGIGWIERGTPSELAFEQLAKDAPDQGVARLFRLLATATSSGSNIADTLRSQADQLRIEHSEHLEQMATKKRSAMVFPSIVLMVPVLLLYVFAPVPQLLFGGFG